MIRLGLLGCGRIGQVHARAVGGLRDAQIAALSDAHRPAAEALAKEAGAEIRDTNAIVTASDIDALVICTPTDTHADLIEAGARAGKPIFCEKPIDLDVARVEACLETVESAGVPLMIGFQRRFDPQFRALKAALAAGEIGKIEQIAITSRDPAPPPAEYITRSGGIFRDCTIHDFDMARFLLGAPLRRLTATSAALVDPEIGRLGDADTATTLIEAESGAQIVITNSRRATYGYDQRVEVLGETGMLQVGNFHEPRPIRAAADGVTQPPLLNFFMDRYAAAYAAEMAAFVDVVASGAPVPVGGDDGRQALILADAATRSAAGAGWVTLGGPA